MASKRTLFAVLGALLLATSAHTSAPQVMAAVGSADDRLMSVRTPWWTFSGITAEQVNAYLAANGARLTDIQVESSTPTFSVVMVKNAGSYQANYWWWYYGQTLNQVNSLVVSNNARLISVSAYQTALGTRYAVAMVRNTGANARKWWWYHASASFITGQLAANRARLIDLGPAPDGGYTAIMVDNSAASAPAWWWYYGIRAKDIGNYAAAHHARPIDVSHTPGGRFNVVMYASSIVGESFAGRTPSAMLAKAIARDDRILSVYSYVVDGAKLEVAAMVRNSP